jgi:hypothetical protein
MSGVDHAKAFCTTVGWRLDIDLASDAVRQWHSE